jgi:signal transduction histidine kinase
MKGTTHRRTLWLFGVLAAYVLLQFLWWAYLLVEKDNELRALIGQLDALGVRSTLSHGDRSRTLLMVAGEGFVFVCLLLIGLWTIYRSVRHELVLARLQRNFLLAASHELRTPIAGLKLHLQTLQRRQLDAEQQRSLMTMALGDVERLGALSEKILLATRLAEARLPLALPMGSDADAVRTIVGNLLENACKYAPPGTAVTITARSEQGGTLIEVADEGPGVPAEERERIFDRFHRGGREETRQTKGTGLGLFIVRRLADALGGSVTLRNGRPHGAIFEVALPDR